MRQITTGTPISAQRAKVLSLHPNTVRERLDALVTGGLADQR